MRRCFSAQAAVLLAAVLAPPVARAEEDDSSKKAMATDLFDKGVKLMNARKCDEVAPATDADKAGCKDALDLFLKAQRAYPKALGPYRNAAFVAKSLGLVALASRNFRHVARNAPLEPTEARRKWAAPAQKEADALEPRIPYVTLTVKNATTDEVQLKLDGEALAGALVGTELAVDPGEHVVTGETKDGRRATVKLTLAEKDKKEAALVFEAKKAPPPPPTTSAVATENKPPPEAPPKRLAPKLVMGAGGVMIGAGLVFGAMAKSAKDACTNGVCDTQGDLDKAKSRATLSTVFVGIGVAAVAGGAIWWSLGKPSKESTASVGVTPGLTSGGVSLRVMR